MFCHCVLLDSVIASLRYFSSVFCLISLFTVLKLSSVRLLSSVVPFFASRSAVSFLCIPTCDGIHWKAIVFSCLLRSFIYSIYMHFTLSSKYHVGLFST
jgi:type III secretory pathway component EscU